MEREIAFHFKHLKDFLEAGEHIAEPREIARRGFRQHHAAGPAARARADASRLKNHDGRMGSDPAQPSRGGEPGESGSDYGEIACFGQRASRRLEMNLPRRRAPGMFVHARSHR